VLVGAAPEWFADNIVVIAAVVLAVVTLLLLRMVKETVTRLILLAIVVGLAVFVYANRVPLEACARECRCRVVRQDVEVPLCNPDLQLSHAVTGGQRPV